MSSEEELNNVLTIKTLQISPFKTLIAALKEILVDTSIEFTHEGMKILDMDISHTIVVRLFLPADRFEFYSCKQDRILIGVNMPIFFKFLSVLENSDTLTLYIPNEEFSDGIVTKLMMNFENESKGVEIIKGMKLIDPNPEAMTYPDIEFQSVINMSSAELQKNVKYLAILTDKIEIKSVGNEVIFSGKGELGTSEARYRECDGNLRFLKKQNSSKVVQGEFSLKSLGYFIKCTNLCPYIEMYLENDIPLIIKYDVASMGEIKFCLSPLPST